MEALVHAMLSNALAAAGLALDPGGPDAGPAGRRPWSTASGCSSCSSS